MGLAKKKTLLNRGRNQWGPHGPASQCASAKDLSFHGQKSWRPKKKTFLFFKKNQLSKLYVKKTNTKNGISGHLLPKEKKEKSSLLASQSSPLELVIELLWFLCVDAGILGNHLESLLRRWKLRSWAILWSGYVLSLSLCVCYLFMYLMWSWDLFSFLLGNFGFCGGFVWLGKWWMVLLLICSILVIWILADVTFFCLFVCFDVIRSRIVLLMCGLFVDCNWVCYCGRKTLLFLCNHFSCMAAEQEFIFFAICVPFSVFKEWFCWFLDCKFEFSM